MTPAEMEGVIRRLFEALNATNAALSATVTRLSETERRLTELEEWEYRHDERITQLEAAKFRYEAPFLPPADKMN